MKQAYQALIKALGRGAKGSRELTFEESKFLISGFHDGIGSQVQLAAALMLMRVRGESVAEIAGAATGIKSTISEQWAEAKPSIDWPCYAGKRELLPWLLLAAKVLADQGERILLHGDPKSLSHRKHIAAYVSALDIPSVSTPDEAKSALDHGGICYVDAGCFSPLVARFRNLHQELGLRSLFQTAIRCTNPAGAPVSLRSYFHPGLDKVHAGIAEMMAKHAAKSDLGSSAEHVADDLAEDYAEGLAENLADDCAEELTEYLSRPHEKVGIFKGVQGECEINPRITTELSIVAKHGRESISLPTLLEGVVGLNTLASHIQLEAERAPQLLRDVWISNSHSNSNTDKFDQCLRQLRSHDEEGAEKLIQLANASVIGTLSMVYLLKGRCEDFCDAEVLARTSWYRRHFSTDRAVKRYW